MQSYKGKIDLKTEPGVGTEIDVDITIPSVPPSKVTTDGDDHVFARTRGMRVCVVEMVQDQDLEDIDNRAQLGPPLTLLLQDWFGMETTSATGWELAKYDLIICIDSSVELLSSAAQMKSPCILIAIDAVEAATLQEDERVIKADIQVLTQPYAHSTLPQMRLSLIIGNKDAVLVN